MIHTIESLSERLKEIGSFWTVLGRARASSRSRRQVTWRCVCICGQERDIDTSALSTGKTKSCGCKSVYLIKLNRGKVAKNFNENSKEIPGIKKEKEDDYNCPTPEEIRERCMLERQRRIEKANKTGVINGIPKG